jgi:hypothetical protein
VVMWYEIGEMWAGFEGFGWVHDRQTATKKGKVWWGRFRANKTNQHCPVSGSLPTRVNEVTWKVQRRLCVPVTPRQLGEK